MNLTSSTQSSTSKGRVVLLENKLFLWMLGFRAELHSCLCLRLRLCELSVLVAAEACASVGERIGVRHEKKYHLPVATRRFHYVYTRKTLCLRH